MSLEIIAEVNASPGFRDNNLLYIWGVSTKGDLYYKLKYKDTQAYFWDHDDWIPINQKGNNLVLNLQEMKHIADNLYPKLLPYLIFK
jgi:hypothetical protein